jgi:DNA-directed RNA polymerase specialized sigma24 family protein
MNEASLKQSGSKKDWQLDAGAFHRLLVYLDEGSNSEGQNYLKMRGRLVRFFDRKNCLAPDELADETLNRVARRLEEVGSIQSETAAKYCYTVARYVFQEYLRQSEKMALASSEMWRQSKIDNPGLGGDEREIKEDMLHCLEQCTAKLDYLSRKIISQYYIGKERAKIENRRALAAELEITINALSVRACRIRDKLETCVKACLSAK